jgi:hypothetical protein
MESSWDSPREGPVGRIDSTSRGHWMLLRKLGKNFDRYTLCHFSNLKDLM